MPCGRGGHDPGVFPRFRPRHSVDVLSACAIFSTITRGDSCKEGASLHTFGWLTREWRLLFPDALHRLFSYGALSVVLFFYLTSLVLTASKPASCLTLTLGRARCSPLLTTPATGSGGVAITDRRWPCSWQPPPGLRDPATSCACLRRHARLHTAPCANDGGAVSSPIAQAAFWARRPRSVTTDGIRLYTLAARSSRPPSGALMRGRAAVALSMHQSPAGRRKLPRVVLYVRGLGAAIGALFTPSFARSPSDESGSGSHRIGRSRAVWLRLSGLFALDIFCLVLVGHDLRRVLVLPAVRVNPRHWARSFLRMVLSGISALLANAALPRASASSGRGCFSRTFRRTSCSFSVP